MKAAILAACCLAQFASGAESPVGDDALRDVVPEKAMPELKAILVRAVANAPRMISAGLDYEQSRIGVKYARSPMLPNASASASYGKTKNRYDYEPYLNLSNAIIPARTSTGIQQTLSYSAGIGQPVYHWGALKKGYQSAQLQRAISERNIAETRRLLALDVRRAYFNLISSANSRDMERVTLANLEKEWEFSKQQAADGFSTTSVASTAEIRLNDYKLQMRRSTDSYEAQWRAFRQLAGLDDTFIVELPKEIPAISTAIGPVVQNISDRQDSTMPISLLNAEDSIHSEQLNYQIYKTRLRPKLGVSISASKGYNTPNNTELYGSGPYTLTSIGAYATVNWNVFDGLYTRALKQGSLIRLRQLKNSRDQIERDYRETLRTQVSNLRLNWESLQKTEKYLADTRASVDSYQKDFDAGFAPKKIWEDAKTSAENALQSANSARADYYMQIVTYLSLRGKDPAVNPTGSN